MSSEIGWQEAVARLAAEKTRAESYANYLVRLDDATVLGRGMILYGEAKAEIDSVISGLVVAVAKAAEPSSLPDLEGRLARGVAARIAFCELVASRLPNQEGERGGVVDLAAKALGPLVDAIKAIVAGAREADRLSRATIQSQLEATRWLDFTALAAAGRYAANQTGAAIRG